MQIVLLLIFVAVTIAVAAVFFILCPGKGDLHDRKVRRIIVQNVVAEEDAKAAPNLLRKEIVDQSSKFRRQLKEISNATRLTKLLAQSGLEMDQVSFLLLAALVGCAIAGIGWLIWPVLIVPVAGFAAGAAIPLLYVKFKAKQRIRRITEQFPDAIEMLVSALRSGQAFATGLATVAEEMPDPTGLEFQQTFDEQNFGVAMNDALEHLRDRVDSMDIEFFVTAVSIQRETGGNLAEILTGLGKTIRGRLKLFGHISALTAQGRLSGWIVSALPAGIAGILYLLNPDYMSKLFTTETGHYLIGSALFLQFCGIMLIRKIVNIKV